MEKMYDELERILSCELDIHNAIVETAGALNKSIRENTLTDIQAYTLRHDEQICQIEKLEARRLEYCSLIGKRLGLKIKMPKLASLIEHAPVQFKSRLTDLHVSLKKKITELSRLTVSNQLLLENAINVISCTFTFIKDSQKKYTPYSSKKKGASPYQAYSLINRTV